MTWNHPSVLSWFLIYLPWLWVQARFLTLVWWHCAAYAATHHHHHSPKLLSPISAPLDETVGFHQWLPVNQSPIILFTQLIRWSSPKRGPAIYFSPSSIFVICSAVPIFKMPLISANHVAVKCCYCFLLLLMLLFISFSFCVQFVLFVGSLTEFAIRQFPKPNN